MFYTDEELRSRGITFGRNIRVHRTAEIIGGEKLSLGDNVRIDCFSLISAGREGVTIGRNVHLAAGVYIFGGGGAVSIEDFAGFSSRVALYTATDDYSQGHLTNPTVPERFRKVSAGPVIVRRHVIVGSGSVIMPGVELGRGAAVGALTYVRKSVPELQIVFGNPARVVGTRDASIFEREQQLLREEKAKP